MRIRLALTLDVRRNHHGDDDGPDIYDLSSASAERAERHPVGFTAEPGRVEPDWEDHR